MALWIQSLLRFMALGLCTETNHELNLVPPYQFVTQVNGSASFSCSPIPSSNMVQWIFDGMVMHYFQDNSERSPTVNGVARLTIESIPEIFNGTVVSCQTRNGARRSRNGTIIILLRGILGPVESLMLDVRSTFQLSWSRPNTINFTDDSGIITYCVDVVRTITSSSITSTTTLHTECDITIPGFAYRLTDPGPCSQIVFIITPVNRAGNGTPASREHPGSANNLYLLSVDIADDQVVLIMSATVCDSDLVLDDVDTKERIEITSRDPDLTIQGTNITLRRTQVKENRRYNVTTIDTYNNNGFVEISTFISTHDIRNATVTVEDTGVTIHTDYFEHSSASGALYIFVPLDDSGAADLTGAVYLALDRNTSRNHTLPFSLSGGELAVFVYDIESDGTLASGVGYPAIQKELVTHDTDFQGILSPPSYSLLTNCSITSTVLHIMIECAYPSKSTAIGYQVVAQQRTDARKLYVNKTAERQTPASFSVGESGMYQITIFAIREGSGVVGSNIEYITQLFVNDQVATSRATEFGSDPSSPAMTTVTTVPSSNHAGLIVGVLVAAIFVIAVIAVPTIIILVYVIRKCNKQMKDTQPGVVMMQRIDPEEHHKDDSDTNPEIECETIIQQETSGRTQRATAVYRGKNNTDTVEGNSPKSSPDQRSSPVMMCTI